MAAPCAPLHCMRGPVRNGGRGRPLNEIVRRHMFSEIGIVVAIILFASGWIAMFMLIGQLKRHYPSIYAELGSPTRWGYFMDARAGWFARDNIKSFKRFLFEREFERLDRPDVRALG